MLMNRFFLLLACLIGINACNISSLNDPVLIPEVEDEFYLDMWENLTPEGRYLEWRLRTIDNASCEEAYLDYTYDRGGRAIDLAINAIINPVDCTPGEQPLEVGIDAGRLVNDTYDLSFSLRESVTNSGQLDVTEQLYEINFEDPSGFVLLRNKLYRIPDQVIWGYVHANTPELKAAAAAFNNDLSQITDPVVLENGYYGHFTILNRNISLNNDFTPIGATIFYYQLNGDDDRLSNLIEENRSNYSEGLTIKVYNTLGEEY
jgi:hypothetical protein